MGFRQQRVKLHHSLRSRTLFWQDKGKRQLGEPRSALPSPTVVQSSSHSWDARHSERDQTGLRDTSEMFCGKRCLSVLTPTRKAQGFGPFSPLASTERHLRWGRTAVVQGADRYQAQRTSLEHVAPQVRTCPGIWPGSSSALHDKHGTAPGRTGSLWSLRWPHTRDQRPTFPPFQEHSQP